MTNFVVLSNSTILDYNSFGSTAPAPSGGTLVTSAAFNVALILKRANDPTPLLSSDWATRQAALADQESIWQQYGPVSGAYTSATSAVGDLGLHTVSDLGSNGYVSGADTRTIWVSLKVDSATHRDDFATLFNASLYVTSGGTYYWANSSSGDQNLSLPDSLASAGVTELAFDTDLFATPIVPSQPTTSGATLSGGWQSPGNATPPGDRMDTYPQQIAQDYYNFPLSGAVVSTGVIGLIEPGIGDAMSGATSLSSALDDYRGRAFSGAVVSGVDVQVVASGGQSYLSGDPGERSLDDGIVTTLDPGSTLVFYAGSGDFHNASSTVFTALQDSFWDDVNKPAVITNSDDDLVQASPNSPFRNADLDLFIDAALRNISVFNSDGDTGSNYHVANGLTNVPFSRTSPYAVMVGGTSLSTLTAALNDPTLASYLSSSPAVVWQLVAGGLTSTPTDLGATERYIETVWNEYVVDDSQMPATVSDYEENVTGTGGVDPTQPVPWYQQAFGLDPTTADGRALTGRGVPDVSANASGNALYRVPNDTMDGDTVTGGTSASAPFWAGLVTQINAILADMDLHLQTSSQALQLGYMNDLLYIAAVIAPGSFNDITIGNNISSYELGGSNYTTGGDPITPTGYGYYAAPGYDEVTGLGTPNGLLLARAISQIANSQIWYSSTPEVITGGDTAGWKSGANQSLLFQTMAGTGTNIGLDIGGSTTSFSNQAADAYAWTSRMAQQSLQSDFDSNLVTMFDGQSQGTLVQANVGSGGSIAVDIDSAATQATQATLSQAYGFADFMSTNGVVRVAQSVAVAQMVNDTSGPQEAIARIRQNGLSDALSLEFYKVDDYEGTVVFNGVSLRPGDPGYEQAADANAYQLSTGGKTIAGPGYGNYTETDLQGVQSGDLVAMLLRNASTTFFAFAPANESVNGQNVAHEWNYGANTWGWEDAWGGGDRDYNDVVVQLDFTSKAGSGLLVGSGGST